MAQPQQKPTDRFEGAIRTFAVVKADSSNDLPTSIELLKAGTWPNSIKGELTITPDDLVQMKANFDKGVGRPGNGQLGLPIDFSHNEWDQAAAWINGIRVDGDTLYADPVEWTDAGKAAVLGGMYKCVSPSFYPSDRGGYVDPEDFDSAAIPNTVVGAGLTNIPFFKGLDAVKADDSSDVDSDGSIIYIKANAKPKKEQHMTLKLEEIVDKENSAITADEREFLTDNKDKLTADQKVKFGFETAPVNADNFSAEDRQVLADIKSGNKVLVDKTEQDALKASVTANTEAVKKMNREKIEADVTKIGIETGRIKADQLSKWSDLVEADATNIELLKAIPENKVLAAEKGAEGGEAKDNEEVIHAATVKIIDAARADGKAAPAYSEARKQAVKQLETETA